MSLTIAPATLEMAAAPAVTQVEFRSDSGVNVQAAVLRVSPQSATFQVQDPTLVLRTSESLSDFKIVLANDVVYVGPAVVNNFVEGEALNCEVGLDEGCWRDAEFSSSVLRQDGVERKFCEFVRSWQQFYLVSNEYKVVIADLESFFAGLRLWLERIERGIGTLSEARRTERQNEIAHELRPRVTAAIGNMFERFEVIAERIDPEQQPVHRAFGRRVLHPYLLCAPFIHRTFVKPLGYAGDYEMMNMIVRNGLEGKTIFSKLVNAYLLDQVGPQAVRNRVDYLLTRIINETSRAAQRGKMARIFCIACGPAWEARNFIAQSPLADHAQFHLLDFNEETLRHTGEKINEVRRLHHRRTQVTFVRNSVQNLLRGKGKANGTHYDLIYCSGLYDYLNNRIISTLNTYLYDQLAPGGLLVVGNFDPSTPVRNFIEHFLDWFLIYRDGKQLAELQPEQAPREACTVFSEHTGANIFLEARKQP
jgi:extracellular factor (EF) 3-hydroxypalmitic acid methyl ester biosynthesis protein